jgi:hypothetical protein
MLVAPVFWDVHDQRCTKEGDIHDCNLSGFFDSAVRWSKDLSVGFQPLTPIAAALKGDVSAQSGARVLVNCEKCFRMRARCSTPVSG